VDLLTLVYGARKTKESEIPVFGEASLKRIRRTNSEARARSKKTELRSKE